MKKLLLSFGIILTLAIQPSKAQNSVEQTARIKAILPVIDQICQDFATKMHLPSLAYGLVFNGQVIHSKSLGITNIPTKSLANNQSVYRVASMSKSITAMAILQLRDAGKLKLDDPVY